MRTRSQPASPGGLVSLEDMKRATRRTRTTRSASRGASQEPSSQETIEPAPQPAPATRARTQRTVKKTTTTTTTKKDTSTASSAADSAPVTSTSTKNKTQKAPKRTTRKGTRKTGKSAADEPQESIGEQYNDAAEAKYRENAKFANEQTGSGSSKVDSALSEQNNSEINRKRSRSEASPDHQDGPATPSANKRRNLGAPGSTPFARHRTPLVRRLSTAVPYSERLRRRRAESQGRIHSTIFRLPQLVAQTEADRLASQTSPPVPPPAEPLNPDLNLSTSLDQTDEQAVPEQSFVTQEPTTPESTRRGWNISGLIQSVPRSFSRFLPRFGRSPASSQASAIPEPSSERIQRTQPSEGFSAPAAENESQPRRRSTDQPPAKRPRNYSLFPNPIDRNLYLGDLTSKPASTIPAVSSPASAFASSSTSTSNNQLPAALSESSQPQPSTTPVVERGRDITPQARNLASESHKKKRKRSPSPDVIPNPEGSSYGMDLRYFTYSSEDEDEEADQASTEPKSETKLPDTLVKIAARNIVGTEKPSSKKVRFDASPEDTPSKQRARATDPYHGRHFIGMNAPPIFSAPTTPTPTPRVVDPRQRPGFIPNRSGTFELDYDAFSDDSDSSGAPSPPSVSTPAAAQASISTQPSTPTSAPSPAARTTARPTQTPSTPAKFDEEALARARSQAEKYKPKTPSGLRTASRYSSPLTAITPDLTPVPTEKIVEKFGDDQFAKDAQWLYENCPSGDLRQLVWPAPRPFGEGLNVSAEAIRIANEIWEPSDVDKAYAVFQREFSEFKQTLA